MSAVTDHFGDVSVPWPSSPTGWTGQPGVRALNAEVRRSGWRRPDPLRVGLRCGDSGRGAASFISYAAWRSLRSSCAAAPTWRCSARWAGRLGRRRTACRTGHHPASGPESPAGLVQAARRTTWTCLCSTPTNWIRPGRALRAAGVSTLALIDGDSRVRTPTSTRPELRGRGLPELAGRPARRSDYALLRDSVVTAPPRTPVRRDLEPAPVAGRLRRHRRPRRCSAAARCWCHRHHGPHCRRRATPRSRRSWRTSPPGRGRSSVPSRPPAHYRR